MKGHDGLPGAAGAGRHATAWPGVSEGNTGYIRTAGGPDRGETSHQDGPKSWEGNNGDRGGKGRRVREQIIYGRDSHVSGGCSGCEVDGS